MLFFGHWVADDRLTQKLERGLGDVSLTGADGHQARRTTCYPDRVQPWLNPPKLTYAYAPSEETSAPNLSNGRKVFASRGRGEQRLLNRQENRVSGQIYRERHD